MKTSRGPPLAAAGTCAIGLACPLSLTSESACSEYTPGSTCASTRRTTADAAKSAALSVTRPVMTSMPQRIDVAETTRRAAGAGACRQSTPLQSRRHDHRASGRACRVSRRCRRARCASALWASIRSRAFSGCSTKAGPPAMCRTTASFPGSAETTTWPSPPLRCAPIRIESLSRPPRLSSCCNGGSSPPPALAGPSGLPLARDGEGDHLTRLLPGRRRSRRLRRGRRVARQCLFDGTRPRRTGAERVVAGAGSSA